MQAEQVAGFQHQRPQLVIAATVAGELIEHGLDAAGLHHGELDAAAGDGEARRVVHHRLPRQQILEQHPGDGEFALVLNREFHRDGFSHFRFELVHLPLGREARGPGAGEPAADEQHAEERVHRVRQQAQFENEREEENQNCAGVPDHREIKGEELATDETRKDTDERQ